MKLGDSNMTTRIVMMSFVATAALSNAVYSQHVWEYVPRPGEQRLSYFQWRATHNSFQRYEDGHWGNPNFRIPMSTQISLHGVRLLELDLTYKEQEQLLWVRHHCADAEGEMTYHAAMDEIQATPGLEDTFVLVYFNKHSFNCGNLAPLPSDWQLQVAMDLETRFGDWVYRSGELRSPIGDNHLWPSIQELIRRGKHIGFVTDGADSLNYFFDYNSNDPPEWYNTDDENDVRTFNDRTLSRTYPAQFTCGGDQHYADAMTNNFTFAAINCLNQHSSHLDPRIHPPFPMYVSPIFSGTAWGTLGAPYFGAAGLESASQRAAAHQATRGPSKIDVKLLPGGYPGMTGRILSGPIVLKSTGAGSALLMP